MQRLQPDQEATLNPGVGMALVLPEASVDAVQAVAAAAGIGSWVAGTVSAQAGEPAVVELHGAHPR